MILAAGRGERMQPLTARLAKPTLHVLNRPLLSYAVDMLYRGGVRNLAVNLHHLPETVEKVLEEWTPEDMRVSFFREEEILGTGGGVKNAQSVLGDQPFFLCNGDFILEADPADALATHGQRNAVATMVLVPYEERMGYTPVWVADGNVVWFGEPPAGKTPGTRHIFTGLHVIEPSVLEGIPAGQSLGLVRPVYMDLLAEGATIAAHITEGAWFEFGTPAQYLRRSLRLLGEPYRKFVEGLGIEIAGSEETAHTQGTGVQISPNASFVGQAVLGDGAAVGRGSWVESCILGRNAVASFEAEIRNCILADDVILPPKSRFDNRVIMNRRDDLARFPGAVRQDELIHFPL